MDEIIRVLSPSLLLQSFLLLIGLFYAGLILWFRRGWKHLPVFEETCKSPEEKVTVIIACHNEEKNLPGLIQAMKQQTYPDDLINIILVEDHSTDHSRKIMEQAAKDYTSIKTLINKGEGKKEALLTALENTSTPWVFTTDADARPGPEWMTVMMAYHILSGAHFLAGPVKILPGKGFFSRFRELEYYSLVGAGMGAAGTGHPLYCNGANLAYKKEVLSIDTNPLRKEIQSGDDVFLLHRVKKYFPETIRFLKSKKATVLITDKSGIGSFFRQRSRWASKGPAYHDRDTLLTAILVFLLNLTIVYAAGAGFFHTEWFLRMLILFIIKSIPDFLLLYSIISFYHRRNLLWIFPLAQLFYPFYITATALAGIGSYPFRGKVWEK